MMGAIIATVTDVPRLRRTLNSASFGNDGDYYFEETKPDHVILGKYSGQQ